MGWPDDARYLTVVDGATLVNADLLNNIQDGVIATRQRGIVDAFGRRMLPRLRTNGLNLNTSDAICYAVGPGGGMKATGVALRSTNDAGTIIQRKSSSVALPYQLAADELQTDHAAAHATLDRYDLIAVQLTDTGTGVTLTKQVVQGSNAAAGTAVEPAIPSGFTRWGAVLVPAAHAGVFLTETHIRDWRVPCGSISGGLKVGREVQSVTFSHADNAGFGNIQLKAGAAGEFADAWLPWSYYSRLLTLNVRAKVSAGGWLKLQRIRYDGGFTQTDLTTGIDTAGVEDVKSIVSNGTAFDDASLQAPAWSNGRSSPNGNTALGEFLSLQMRSGANGDYIQTVQWEFAE